MTLHHGDHRKAYFGVLVALLVLTVVTVWTAYHDYGFLNIVVAMAIATVKAGLVVSIFMNMRGEEWGNRIAFASSFIFLVIFVFFSLSDILTRPEEAAAKVNAIEPAGGNASQMKPFVASTPELVAHGKEVYTQNCVACHGPQGLGDGPAAAALNPKPRDFTSGIWKAGGAPSQVFQTLTKGLQGSPMPGFSTLSVKDRWALTHFVRSLSPNTPPDTNETLAAIGLGEGSSSSTQEKPELPMDFVMKRMVDEAARK